MYKKGNVVYADAYKYLVHKSKGIIAFAQSGDESEFEEKELPMPIKIIDEGSGFYSIQDVPKVKFYFSKSDYVTIKTEMIKKRYSNDDQIAIMLNAELSEEDKVYYNKMQEWREFSGYIARQIESITPSMP
jgi:hypothetical protein